MTNAQLHGDVLSWATDLNADTLAQAQATAAMPFVAKPMALMPDAHFGYGSTIGSVIATRGAIIPSAVGVDIGCGMIAVRSALTSNDLPDDLTELHRMITAAIPAGVPKKKDKGRAQHADPQTLPESLKSPTPTVAKVLAKARLQLGTLGSGNHFVEVCLDETDHVWIMLHSGSRGPGNILAQQHIATAKGLMADWFIELPNPDLAYLVDGTHEFKHYIADMQWAQQFAYESRQVMLDAAIYSLTQFLGRPANFDKPINCHHNYTTREHCRGRNYWVTRKGAISARPGQLGIIPGSMATGSYIVEGLGSEASFHSASHGAGRTMSRTQARKTLSVEGLRESMAGKAWNAEQANALLDEHPDAYKDIATVMAAQSDLVRPVNRLTQILNYKGA